MSWIFFFFYFIGLLKLIVYTLYWKENLTASVVFLMYSTNHRRWSETVKGIKKFPNRLRVFLTEFIGFIFLLIKIQTICGTDIKFGTRWWNLGKNPRDGWVGWAILWGLCIPMSAKKYIKYTRQKQNLIFKNDSQPCEYETFFFF